MERCDLVIVGAGVVGLSAALAYVRRHPKQKVVVLDKETALAAHASGRNSGVLHAGFYYSADSLKAAFSVAGNRAMREYCLERGLPLRQCGKLVVARDVTEHPVLDELVARGQANGVRLERITEAEARRIEPAVTTAEIALWSPDTAVVDPVAIVRRMAEEARENGVDLRMGTRFVGRTGGIITTDRGPLTSGLVLNCAGAYADRVASAWGVGGRHVLVPFRGRYLLGDVHAPALRCCVYPVPAAGMPFLGVHLTVTPDGRVKIGPTAAPARWREDYGGLSGFRLDEVSDQVRLQGSLFLRNKVFRAHALRELAKHSRTWLVREASRLVSGLTRGAFRTWGRTGVRAQLVDKATGSLVTDFVVERAERSVHVLNAVSPAFTCAFPFAEHLCDQLEQAA